MDNRCRLPTTMRCDVRQQAAAERLTMAMHNKATTCEQHRWSQTKTLNNARIDSINHWSSQGVRSDGNAQWTDKLVCKDDLSDFNCWEISCYSMCQMVECHRMTVGRPFTAYARLWWVGWFYGENGLLLHRTDNKGSTRRRLKFVKLTYVRLKKCPSLKSFSFIRKQPGNCYSKS